MRNFFKPSIHAAPGLLARTALLACAMAGCAAAFAGRDAAQMREQDKANKAAIARRHAPQAQDAQTHPQTVHAPASHALQTTESTTASTTP